MHLGTGFVQTVLDVSHRDVLLQSGRRTTGRNIADLLARLIDNLSAFTGRRTLHDKANAASRHTAALGLLLQLLQDNRVPVEPALCAAVFANDPRQRCFDGSRGVVQVVAVETHTSLEAECVARTKAGKAQLVFGVVEEELGDGFGSRRGDADFETVLSSVSRTTHEHLDVCAFDGCWGALAKVQRLEGSGRLIGEDARKEIGRQRPLESDQTLAIEDVPLDGLVGILFLPRLELFRQVSLVLLSTASIGDDVKSVWQARNDCVVDNTAGLWVQQGGQCGLVFGQGGQGGGSNAL